MIGLKLLLKAALIGGGLFLGFVLAAIFATLIGLIEFGC